MADFRLQIDKSGRILLPLELRKEEHLKTGDTLVLRKINNEMYLLKFEDVIKEIHEAFASKKRAGLSMTDEVLKMRKKELEIE